MKGRKPPNTRPSSGHQILNSASLILAVLVVVIYAQTRDYGFINYDDDAYITHNAAVLAGWTWDGLRWAFSSFDYFYWQPLTWLSHMTDCQFFGLDAGLHHLVNAGIHLVNTLFLLRLLMNLTGCPWRSSVAAALFAVHPLHVESVAWIAERKDVLSGFFWMLTIWSYARYVSSPSTRRYLLVAASMALGLMAKPSLVTAPVLLLLLDFWPLQRKIPVSALIREKIPLLCMSLAISVATYIAQFGARHELKDLTLPIRFENAIASYGWYLAATVWPSPLAVLYPYQHDVPGLAIGAPAVILVGVTCLVFWQRRRRPYLLTGWFWFLLVLAPNIGLIQAGPQARADRFTYIASIGLGIAVVWYAAEALKPRLALALAGSVLLILTAVSYAQAGYWKDSITIFEHTVAVTRENPIAQRNLAAALVSANQIQRAIPHFTESLRLQPNQAETEYQMASALMKTGSWTDALAHFNASVNLYPQYASAHFGAAVALFRLQRLQEAAGEYRESLRLGIAGPFAAQAYNDLGVIAGNQGDIATAEARFQAAVAADPALVEARRNLEYLRARRAATSR